MHVKNSAIQFGTLFSKLFASFARQEFVAREIRPIVRDNKINKLIIN